MGMYKELGLKKLYGVKPKKEGNDVEYILSQSEAVLDDFRLIVDTYLEEWDKVAPIVLKVALTKYLEEVALSSAKNSDDVEAVCDRMMTYARIEKEKAHRSDRTVSDDQVYLAAVLLLKKFTKI